MLITIIVVEKINQLYILMPPAFFDHSCIKLLIDNDTVCG